LAELNCKFQDREVIIEGKKIYDISCQEV